MILRVKNNYLVLYIYIYIYTIIYIYYITYDTDGRDKTTYQKYDGNVRDIQS